MGYSPSGQVFNLPAESVAAELAAQLQADKLIIFDELKLCSADGERISTFTPTSLERTVDAYDAAKQSRLAALIRAVRAGVSKSHLVSYEDDGALLAELFTAAGVGTQVVEQQRRAVRPAKPDDVSAIVEVIRPLEETGVLVRRERDRLEQEIDHFIVAELDGIVVGCCAVYPFGDQAELACVAVHENFRNNSRGGVGASLLEAAEAAAAHLGARTLFVLTTQTRDWFREHGFADATPQVLPQAKHSLYNWQRNSAVMTKALR
jgi:amino-acid N-acetyltransferase